MNLDDFIKEAVSTGVQKRLSEVVADTVSEIMSETLGDPSFQDAYEEKVTESIHEALTPREQPEKKFKNVAQFVDGFIRPHYPTSQAKQDQANWSKRWYDHPEVVARLDALWRTYERMRAADPQGFLESFLRVHADYHMRQIMSDTGVFASCSHTDTPSIPLPVLPPKPKTDRPDSSAQNTVTQDNQ